MCWSEQGNLHWIKFKHHMKHRCPHSISVRAWTSFTGSSDTKALRCRFTNGSTSSGRCYNLSEAHCPHPLSMCYCCYCEEIYILSVYVLISRERGRREWEREPSMEAREKHSSVACHVPQPVNWTVTFCFLGWHPANWAAAVRAAMKYLYVTVTMINIYLLIFFLCMWKGGANLPSDHYIKSKVVWFGEIIRFLSPYLAFYIPGKWYCEQVFKIVSTGE